MKLQGHAQSPTAEIWNAAPDFGSQVLLEDLDKQKELGPATHPVRRDLKASLLEKTERLPVVSLNM